MSRMKEKFQEWQQVQEDAIERLMEAGYSREAAWRQIEYLADLHKSVGGDLHNPGIIPKMHKEDE
jgi:predicted Ser/Thr protein kinase